jgi:hypothetical protein
MADPVVGMTLVCVGVCVCVRACVCVCVCVCVCDMQVMADPAVGVTLSHLRGHEGADSLVQVRSLHVYQIYI